MNTMPNFLVIGAQKSGTTTLYEDLRSHPDILIPDKETSGLVGLDPNDITAVTQYADLFESEGNRLVGEVSTEYTMAPRIQVAKAAQELLGSAQVFYIVREPVSRVISHHHHEYASGLMGPDIDVELQKHPQLVYNSCYATQLIPWLDGFGRSKVHIIRFEDYMSDRDAGANSIFRRLGLEPWKLPTAEKAFNTSDNRFLATGLWRQLSRSGPYRRLVRPIVSESVRRRVMQTILPKPASRPDPPSERTIAHLIDVLRPEVAALSELTETEPWWDLDQLWETTGG